MSGASFTMLLKDVIDHAPDGNIGLLSYEIFDEEHRSELNQKIIDHYWNREIGVETISQFSFNVRRRMNEIMPYYNQLFASEKLKYDPLNTINIKSLNSNDMNQTSEANSLANGESVGNSATDSTAKAKSTGKSNATNTSGSTAESLAVNSDTPQTMLSDDEDYATNGNRAKSSGTGTSVSEDTSENNTDDEGKVTSNDKTTSTTTDNTKGTAVAKSTGETSTVGYQGVPADLLMRYRDSILNIDLMIIERLRDLFMLVIGNGDNYTNAYTLESYYL